MWQTLLLGCCQGLRCLWQRRLQLSRWQRHMACMGVAGAAGAARGAPLAGGGQIRGSVVIATGPTTASWDLLLPEDDVAKGELF